MKPVIFRSIYFAKTCDGKTKSEETAICKTTLDGWGSTVRKLIVKGRIGGGFDVTAEVSILWLVYGKKGNVAIEPTRHMRSGTLYMPC